MEIKIRHAGQDHSAEAQMIQGKLWMHFEGRTWSVDADKPTGTRRGKSAAGGSSDTVAAPMPGKVTKILVEQGQDIQKGQPVLVMEAMKMEYTLKSDLPGKIARIECAVGDQVVLGKALVKIEPNKS